MSVSDEVADKKLYRAEPAARIDVLREPEGSAENQGNAPTLADAFDN